MDREAEIRRLRAGNFTMNNGKVLLTINLLREKYNSLKSVKRALSLMELKDRNLLIA